MKPVSLQSILGLVALASLLAVSPAHVEAGPGWWGDLDKGVSIDLADLMSRPLSYKQKQVTFTCITSGKSNVHFQESAMLSKQRYTNYAVYPDGAVVWQKADFLKRDFPFLYIAKNHFQHDALLGLRKFTHIEVTGRVKAILRNKAHIEVTSFRETSWLLGRETVDEMVGGELYLDGGNLDLAVGCFERALRPDLPPKYALLVRKQLGAVYRQLGRTAAADRIEGGGGILTGRADKRAPFTDPNGEPREIAPAGLAPRGMTNGGLAPPIDDQLPGTRWDAPLGFPPVGSGNLATPPGGRMAQPMTPSPSRAARANPFLDEDLPGSAPGTLAGRASTPPRGAREAPLQPMRPAPRNAERYQPGFGPADDLPGQPVYPGATGTPGRPVPVMPAPGSLRPPPGGTTPPPRARPSVPPQPPLQPAVTPAPRPRPGQPVRPPKRRPRLAGVK